MKALLLLAPLFVVSVASAAEPALKFDHLWCNLVDDHNGPGVQFDLYPRHENLEKTDSPWNVHKLEFQGKKFEITFFGDVRNYRLEKLWLGFEEYNMNSEGGRDVVSNAHAHVLANEALPSGMGLMAAGGGADADYRVACEIVDKDQ